jgi:hypothetical protein
MIGILQALSFKRNIFASQYRVFISELCICVFRQPFLQSGCLILFRFLLLMYIHQIT